MENRTYNFRDNKIILIGDSHDTEVVYDIISTRVPNGSDVCHVGDVGLGFGKESYAIPQAQAWLNRFNKLCVSINVRVFLIIGNHDNPKVWELPSTDNVILVKSGDIGIFPNGKKALLIGGGISVDRWTRTGGIDYWQDELTPYLENVEKCDIMFSHDCPEHFNHATDSLLRSFDRCVKRDPTLMEDALKQRLNMTDITKRSDVKTIIGGHFHRSIREEKDGVYYRCLDINELWEFDAELEYKL